MRVAGIDFQLSTRSINIFLSGCRGPHCPGCHNPEIWSFDIGKKLNSRILDQIQLKIKKFPELIKNIFIMGGEPLHQPESELVKLILNLRKMNLDVWLFTRYEKEQISSRVLEICDFVKTGKYDREQSDQNNIQFNIKLASVNQKIYKVS